MCPLQLCWGQVLVPQSFILFTLFLMFDITTVQLLNYAFDIVPWGSRSPDLYIVYRTNLLLLSCVISSSTWPSLGDCQVLLSDCSVSRVGRKFIAGINTIRRTVTYALAIYSSSKLGIVNPTYSATC